MPSPLQQLTPGQVRAALVAHLARKLSWSGRTVAHLLEPLSNDEIARCLAVDPEETRAALCLRSGLTIGAVGEARHAGERGA